MMEASNSVHSIRESFLEEVMFKVKSVSIRPKEGTEHAHCATSSNSTYLATFHRPGLSLSSNEKFVLLLITMLQNDPKLEAKTITTSLCPTILLTKNLSRAQLGGFSVLHEVSGGRSVAISWRMGWPGGSRSVTLICTTGDLAGMDGKAGFTWECWLKCLPTASAHGSPRRVRVHARWLGITGDRTARSRA